nr:reverse transcriptase domain-containing protein [Tanacetum cinerariifolium]
MPPMMTTRSASRPAAASRGGGTGERAGSGGGRTRGRFGDQDNGKDDRPGGQVGGQGSENLLPTIVAQVGDHGRSQGNGRNQNGDAVNDNIRDENQNEYDGKGGAIVYTCWIEKIESVHDMSGCRDSQRVKYTAGLFIGKALTWWNSEIRTRG